jgi:hypothetical protein
MAEYTCNYCNASFKILGTLKNHQKRAKYCLEIQQTLNKNIIKDFEDCIYCFKSFAKNIISRHLETCKDKKINPKELKYLKKELEQLKKEFKEQEKEIIQKDLIISRLEAKIEIYENDHECLHEIAKQPKNSTIHNTKTLIINTPLDFNDTDKIREIINNKYSIDYIFDGQKGIAQFAVQHVLTDGNGDLKYVCTDPSRQIFKYKDIHGEIQRDVEAKKLTNYLVDGGIKEKVKENVLEYSKDENGNIDGEKFSFIAEKLGSMIQIKEEGNIFKKEVVCSVAR